MIDTCFDSWKLIFAVINLNVLTMGSSVMADWQWLECRCQLCLHEEIVSLD